MRAPGKVNLFLQVGPRRPDGYHQVRTVMHALSLCDELEMELREGEDRYETEPEWLRESLPWTEGNLARRAWELFREMAGAVPRGTGLYLRLRKRIPLAGGMGGGSADAAAVLLGLNLLCEEPLDGKRLEELGAELGSDVPFFLVGGAALAEGRGEEVTPLGALPRFYAVMANPGVPLSTAEVYARFDARGAWSEGAGKGFRLGDLEAFLECLRSGDAARIFASLRNDLQEACLELSPEADRLRGSFADALRETGGRGACSEVMVSGSGPTLYDLLEDGSAAKCLAERMAEEAPLALAARLSPHGCRVITGDERRRHAAGNNQH